MDVLEPWQREIIVQTVSAAKADNFVRAEGLEKFDGVVMKYVATDNLDAVPSAGDGRTLLIPVTGVTADSLLGWYSLFKIGGTLGGVFSAHYKDRAIDFSKVSADKIPIQAVNFFKTRGEKVTQTLLFEMTKGDIRDLGLLKAISFYLPMAQRIPIDAFVQAARMAVQQVGSAA